MKYKLIAIDMDGTLLNSENEISQRNKESIKTAASLGINIVLSTGRLFKSAYQYANDLEITSPIISCNGAYVTEKDVSKIMYKAPLEQDVSMKVIELSEKEKINYYFLNDSTFYISEVNSYSEFFQEWSKKADLKIGEDIIILKEPLKAVKENNIKVYKFIFIEEDKDKLIKFKEKLKGISGIEVVSSWWNNIEVMKKGVSKGSALKELCKKLDIDKEQVIAIGDNENDISMLEFAGLAVAMGNGDDKVKKIANYVTDTNDNDGVGKAIEKHILKKNPQYV